VVDIFERIAAGSSILAEVDRLNQLGVPSVEGKLWRTSRLSTLLHNPIYLGNHPYRTKTSETPRKAPPLVTKPLWDAVQVQLKRNLSRNHSKTRFNLLRGLIRCENCGSTFVGSTMGRHYYYRCSRTLPASEPDRSKRCKAGYLRADAVEALVWGECADLLQNPDMVLQLELDTLEELRARDANRAAEVRKLQEGLAERAAERDFMTRQARKGHLSKAEAETHLAEIRAQELPLHAELARFEDQKSLAAAHLQRIREAEAVLRELRAKTNLDDPEDRRKAVEALLQRMAVKTTGTGKDKKAQITLRWLGQEPFIVVNLKDLNHEVTPATLLDDLDDVVSSGSTL
jgi:Recombinase zinc beta ribbon domain/Recombinase